MSPAVLLNGSLAAPYVNKDGRWLNSPQAVLYGFSDGRYKTVIVSLDMPVYDSAAKVRHFSEDPTHQQISMIQQFEITVLHSMPFDAAL